MNDEKDYENMTIREIKEYKEKIKQDLKELLDNFFSTHQKIYGIYFYNKTFKEGVVVSRDDYHVENITLNGEIRI